MEKVAELEHLQWIEWNKSIVEFLLEIKDISENDKVKNLINNKIASWEKCWVDYSKLSEENKEKDREWARKVINLIKK
jgi:hypothetical protein